MFAFLAAVWLSFTVVYFIRKKRALTTEYEVGALEKKPSMFGLAIKAMFLGYLLVVGIYAIFFFPFTL